MPAALYWSFDQVKSEFESSPGPPHSTVLARQPAAPSRLAQTLPLTSTFRKAILWLSRCGEKLPKCLAEIRTNWPEQGPVQVVFRGEARVGRINDVCCCWAPKPLNLLCQAMRTHESSMSLCSRRWGLRPVGFTDFVAGQHRMHAVFLDEVDQRTRMNTSL